MTRRVQLHCGSALIQMRAMPEHSVDAVVTDPPYGLSFMGKRWDYDVPAVAFWAECLRLLKPGGHLLAFAGTRTQHRMAVKIEDAGFEIRDMIAWVYGSGFPKSLDVAKAIDKVAGAERKVVGSKVTGRALGGAVRDDKFACGQEIVAVTEPATEAAKRWQGWGTALKPALEPITVARKPIAGPIVENVLNYGTGALNVDACRVGSVGGTRGSNYPKTGLFGIGGNATIEQLDAGRWPANLIHDGDSEATALLGEAARFFYCAKASKRDRNEGCERLPRTGRTVRQDGCAQHTRDVAMAENYHPTVKPTALMRYLVRLVTPPGGVVLDPFMGSGTTGKAAVLEGFRFVGIDRTEDYLPIARARIAKALWQARKGRPE